MRTQAQTLAQPRTIVTDPTTGRPEFSDVVEAKQTAAAPETKAPIAETPAPQPAAQAAPTETPAAAQAQPTQAQPTQAQPAQAEPGPSGEELLDRLGKIKDRLEKQETAAPGSADEDLIQQAQDSLDLLRAKKATGVTEPRTPGETLDQFNQRLSAIADRKAAAGASNAPGRASGGMNSIFNRLVHGEAGQAGLPGAVTNADEGIAEIQNRPVIAQKTQQVPARGYLNMVGADRASVLKTPADAESVLYHSRQIAQNGPPDVELHLDEDNNVIGAQGRHRAIAAIEQGGPNAKVNVTVFKHPHPNPQ